MPHPVVDGLEVIQSHIDRPHGLMGQALLAEPLPIAPAGCAGERIQVQAGVVPERQGSQVLPKHGGQRPANDPQIKMQEPRWGGGSPACQDHHGHHQ